MNEHWRVVKGYITKRKAYVMSLPYTLHWEHMDQVQHMGLSTVCCDTPPWVDSHHLKCSREALSALIDKRNYKNNR